MDMRVLPITDEKLWNDFVDTNKLPTFLQSWAWGKFNELQGEKIFRFGICENNTLVAVALFIKISARRGTFLLCPHGPVFALTHTTTTAISSILQTLTKAARALALEEHCDFVRLCSTLTNSNENQKFFKELGYRAAPLHMHPELSSLLDINKPEDELLANMRKTTRYLIKKAEKDGVTIEMSDKPEDIDRFCTVYQATVDRQHFTPFSRSYLENEFKTFAPHAARWFFARYQTETIAAAMIIYSSTAGFYHHGASIQKYNKIPAAYLLQWEAIKEARRRGCVRYNFWGISPENKPKHPWAGLSLFKKGFGGYIEAYVPAQDLPLTRKYWLNFAIETIRKIRRGL